jgi:hypothetical protein
LTVDVPINSSKSELFVWLIELESKCSAAPEATTVFSTPEPCCQVYFLIPTINPNLHVKMKCLFQLFLSHLVVGEIISALVMLIFKM